MKNFLKTDKTRIVSRAGKPVVLKGVNLGGWLMMEAYILHAPNHPEHKFKKEFAAALGQKALRSFEHEYRGNFIRENIFKILPVWDLIACECLLTAGLLRKHLTCMRRKGSIILTK